MARAADNTNRSAFSLVELLVVLGIIALLIGILLPTLSKAKVTANIVKARSDLRQIGLALMMYQQDHRKQLPPTRFSCSSRTEYELPMELGAGRYLPARHKPYVGIVVNFQDVFDLDDTYKYRAVGAAIQNETTLVPDGSMLWVPAGYPNCDGIDGQYWNDPKQSPVRYAIWSKGPKPKSVPGLAPGRAPVPSLFWCRGGSDGGVITIFQDKSGDLRMND